jgi:hypothetical protein
MLSKEMDMMMIMTMIRNELLEMLMDGWVDHTYNETVKQNKKENGIFRPGNKMFQMWNERTVMTKETNSMDTMWKHCRPKVHWIKGTYEKQQGSRIINNCEATK